MTDTSQEAINIEVAEIDGSLIQTLHLSPPDKKSHYLRISLKGKNELFRKHGSEAQVNDWLHELHKHLSDHGFAGWRVIDNLLINMAEVQAVWTGVEGD